MIFAFLDDAEVYFKLRAVCRQIKEYAEKYTELGKFYHSIKIYLMNYLPSIPYRVYLIL